MTILMSVWRLASAIALSVSLMQPVAWCDCCGELYAASEMVEVDCTTHTAEMCGGCCEYWDMTGIA